MADVDCTQEVKHQFENSIRDDHVVSWSKQVAMLSAVSLIYLPILGMIWKNRYKQVVYFKSPLMIMTGGISLYIDAVANLVQMSLTDAHQICTVAIFDTVVFHYISYFSIIFRAYRVFKVMRLEKKYLEDIYKMTQIRADQFDNEDSDIKDVLFNQKNELTKSRMRESEFEEELIKNQTKRENEIKACQEAFFIKRIALIVLGTTTFGVCSYLYIDPFFDFMPIFRATACREIQETPVTLRQLNYNQITFLLVNWAELAMLYFVWRWLIKTQQNQMNIRHEIRLTTIGWFCGSLLYLVPLSTDKQNGVSVTPVYVAVAGIQLRNLCTFLATTVYTLHQLYYGTEVEINSDNRIRNKLGILDLNIIMTHTLTFDYFKTYISTQAQDHTVYLNLYCLVQIYRKKLDQMRIILNILKKNQGDAFDPKSNEDQQLTQNQLTIARNMLNILNYINQHYHSHFRDLKIEQPQWLDTDGNDKNQSTDQSQRSYLQQRTISLNSGEEFKYCDNTKTAEPLILKSAPVQISEKEKPSPKSIQKGNQDIMLMVEPSSLEKYTFISLNLETLGEGSFCRPLCFDTFFNRCQMRLDKLFKHKFKKDKIFNDLLLEICQTEIKEEFYEKVKVLYKKQSTNKAQKSPVKKKETS